VKNNLLCQRDSISRLKSFNYDGDNKTYCHSLLVRRGYACSFDVAAWAFLEIPFLALVLCTDAAEVTIGKTSLALTPCKAYRASAF